jgi:hypothetical protein
MALHQLESLFFHGVISDEHYNLIQIFLDLAAEDKAQLAS